MSAQHKSSLEESFISVHGSAVSGVPDTATEPLIDDEKSQSVDPTIPRRLVLSAHADTAADLLPSLKGRLAAVRYPDEIESSGWSYGMDNKTLKVITEEWLHHYDWEKELEQLNNDFDHWTCQVNGLDIHYVRHDPWAESVEDPVTGETVESPYAGKRTVSDKGEVIMPLLLIHGWPGSWYEFGKAIKLLKKRGRFQIIAPSLPGFGWSQGKVTKNV